MDESMLQFASWLVRDKKISEASARVYVRNVKNSEEYIKSERINLFAPCNNLTSVVVEILENMEFLSHDKTKRQGIKTALRAYLEYIDYDFAISYFEKKELELGKSKQYRENPQKNDKQSKKILSVLMEQFAEIEQEQRKIVLESYDIEDEEESIRAEKIASSHIRKIRQWKADMNRIFGEMADSGFVFEVTPSCFKSEIPQRPTAESPTVERSAPTTSQTEGVTFPVGTAELGKTQPTLPTVEESVSVKPELAPPFVESVVSEEIQVKSPPVEVPIVEKPQITPPPVAEKSRVVPSPIKIPVIEEPQLIPQKVEVPLEKSPGTEPLQEPKSSVLPQANPRGIMKEMCLLGKSYAYSTAVEFFIKVCEMMVLHRPYAVGTFCENKSLNPENQVNFSYHESDLNNQGIRLNNGLWVNKNQEESRIVALCYNVVKACGFEESDLIFKLEGG